ncbi:FliI/YscN family ATPase [Porphyrobacter algicida]|uniref:FliI/YscN family ATPase n=1 Tax=Qipengyuania algicida TaxID=1836209 RepID=A0A845ABN0_9SPHN|nr:FliI/YscN family ATPase [Qipengyuania algicida]MXP27650.1 FliI/YscN family ATPase [Qipengyuania algicida]
MLRSFDDMAAGLTQAPIDFQPARFGLVTSCDGPLIEVSGLSIPIGSLCRIAQGRATSHLAEVIGFRNGRTLMSLLGDAVLLRPGARVRPSGLAGTVPVGEGFLGRAVDGLGKPIDGGCPVRATSRGLAGGERVGALERGRVRERFATGIRAIDSLTTLGVGQRVGIVAGSGVGKSVMIDMIAHGAEADIVVVGLIGERAREVSDFVGRHMHSDAAARTAVVAVPADHAPNLRLRGAMLATSLAEYFRAQGHKVLLILDSLTRVAHAAREIALMLGEHGGARGYPPSALATITRLVERAGNSVTHGGSVTGLYTVLADGDDHNDPVVDTARAILDGHIVLSRQIAQRGRYPAIDVPASLSRVMADIASPDHLAAAREMRSLISAYESNRDLLMMGAYRPGTDAVLDRAIAAHDSIEAFLGQDIGKHVSADDAIGALNAVIARG